MSEGSTENQEKGFFSLLIAFVKYLFIDEKGQIMLMLFIVAGSIAFMSAFSEPIVAMIGFPIIPITLSEEGRIARIIMMYHSIAIPFLAAVVLLVLTQYDLRPNFKEYVRWPLFIGALLTVIGGISFAYIFFENWIMHGLFLVGLSLVFYSGVTLIVGIFPTRKFPSIEKNPESPYLGGINLEYFDMMLAGLCLLISAIMGAIPGAHFGNGFEAILAEDIVRLEHGLFERMIISHLHAMVALLAAVILVLVFRYSKFSGKVYKVALVLTIIGVIVLSIGDWLVAPGWEKAHVVINVGAVFLMVVSVMLAILGWIRTSKLVLGSEYQSATIGQKIAVVFKDPVKFGLYFEFLWVLFSVMIPGVYVALNLETFRSEAYTEIERVFNAGHWHVLATLMAIMVMLLVIDYFGAEGKIRQLLGWMLTIGSILAFGFAQVYMIRTPEIDTSWAIIPIDIGVAMMVIAVGIYCIYLIVSYFKQSSAIKWHK